MKMTLEVELTSASGNDPLTPADALRMAHSDNTDKLRTLAATGLARFAEQSETDVLGGFDAFEYTVITRMVPGMFGIPVPTMLLAINFTALPMVIS